MKKNTGNNYWNDNIPKYIFHFITPKPYDPNCMLHALNILYAATGRLVNSGSQSSSPLFYIIHTSKLTHFIPYVNFSPLLGDYFYLSCNKNHPLAAL